MRKHRLLSAILVSSLILVTLPLSALANSDDTPPVIEDIYMSNPGGIVTPGESLYFDIAVKDDSEIVNASLIFKIKNENDNFNDLNSRFVSYDADSGIAKVRVDISQNIPNATWKLESITVRDSYGNVRSLSPSYPEWDYNNIKFTVENGADDCTPPTILSIQCTEESTIALPGESLYFDIAVKDDSEIVSAFLIFKIKNENFNNLYSEFVSYDADSGIAKVRVDIPQNTPSATWKLDSILVKDYYENETVLSNLNPKWKYDNIQFTVANGADDCTPPTVLNIQCTEKPAIATPGELLYFDIAVKDVSEIVSAFLIFKIKNENDNFNSLSSRFVSYDADSDIAKVRINIPQNAPSATWKLDSILVEDCYGNTCHLNTYSSEWKYDNVDFTVISPVIPPTSVSIPVAIEVPVRSTATIRPTVEPITSLPDWTWISADTSIAEVTKIESGKACLISGVSTGVTTITGTTQNGLTATTTVKVTDAPLPESGTVESSYHVEVGKFIDIYPVLTPSNATALYEITSDNPHIVSVYNTGSQAEIRLQGNNAGKANITIRTNNSLVMTTTVTVGRPTDTQHEKEVYGGYEPTCTRPGRTDEVRCSACRYIFTKSESIPATGHSFGEWVIIKPATNSSSGIKERICSTCDRIEREIIPATGSSGRPIGSGSSGSSSSKSQNITASSQQLPVTIKNGVINVSATDKQIETTIANSANTGVVEIDLTSVKNAATVNIPRKMVAAINENHQVSNLSITAESGSITMSSEALTTVANAMTGNNDQVTFKIDKINAATIPPTQKYPIANVSNSAVFVELSASVTHRDENSRVVSTDVIQEFNGNIEVSIPFERPANMEGRKIIACHIAKDGAITYFPIRYENGIVTFTTTHFSTYAIVESYALAFDDIDLNAWYMLGVESVLEQGLMGDCGNGTFAPESYLSRAMLAKILYTKAEKPAVTQNNTFTDVKSDAWYADAIAWASEKGIINGYDNGSFRPNDDITREQFAVMLWRYAGSPAPPNLLLTYSDTDTISDYAQDALRWAVDKGVIKGKGDGTLDPTGKATRAEVAQMLKNYMDIIQ